MISPVKIWRRQKEIRSILGKRGTVVSFTHIQVPADQFKQYAPYMVAMIELEGGERIVGQVVDSGDRDIKIGSTVMVTLRKIGRSTEDGVIAYGMKFKLLS